MGDASEMPSKAAKLKRDTSKDGFSNTLEYFTLSNFKPFWQINNAIKPLEKFWNTRIIKSLLSKTAPRPYPLSTIADYTSWPAVTDTDWFSRHLPPEDTSKLPPLEDVVALFRAGEEGPRPSETSSYLFPCFAQWFTDGFLMTDPENGRKTTTTHQIDLNQVYGLTPDQTDALRLWSGSSGQKGRLLTEIADAEEFAPRLFNSDGSAKPEFAALPMPERLTEEIPIDRRATMFAFGGSRANATAQTAMINTLFLREHNRIAGVLEDAHPSWDDERVFQTARIINIAVLIKIVIEDYINHISPYFFQLRFDGSVAWKADWNRPNWIPVEFNVLYRWHALVPDQITWNGVEMPTSATVLDNSMALQVGMAQTLALTADCRARELGLMNTPEFLLDIERTTLALSRQNQIAPYNDYREAFSYPRATRFEQVSSNPKIVEALRDIYGHVDKVEFWVGLLAEDPRPNAAVPSLLGRMVAIDAFSHGLTNPLLAPGVYSAETFTPEGLEIIEDTRTLADLVTRNSDGSIDPAEISMELAD